MLTLYDAPRCPYCARVRIVLAEKAIEYETVAIDLDDRPAWIRELNPPDGRVPVLEEEGGFLLPESRVIMQFLDERFPEPPLLPADPAERALANLVIERFDRFGDAYYALYFERPSGSVERVQAELSVLNSALAAHPYLAGSIYSLADVAYVPWVLRAESRLGLDVRAHGELAAWLDRLAARPAVAAELEVVAALGR